MSHGMRQLVNLHCHKVPILLGYFMQSDEANAAPEEQRQWSSDHQTLEKALVMHGVPSNVTARL